ncbi:MAG TPA: hypothetical protein VHG30_01770, partial [Microvirga sp.]|nr:hypothetical protein [Microvirga sp.]
MTSNMLGLPILRSAPMSSPVRRRSRPVDNRLSMRTDAPEAAAVEPALADAERKGFRLAVIGRTCALVSIAFYYLALYAFPNDIYTAGLILATAAVGLVPLRLVGSRHERIGRYALFTFDAAAVSAILA